MSQVKVEWLQRVNGRRAGQVETVELTPFIQGCSSQRRLRILEWIEEPRAIVGVFMDTSAPSEPVTAEADDEFVAQLVEEMLKPVAPEPKPRAPRKPKVTEE